MKDLNFSDFIGQVNGLFTRQDESGFVRVWGYLVNEAEEVVTFWRHKADVPFSFMFLASYVEPTTLARKEEEKVMRGYDPRDPKRRKHRALLREIFAAFQDTLDNDGYHYTPKR